MIFGPSFTYMRGKFVVTSLNLEVEWLWMESLSFYKFFVAARFIFDISYLTLKHIFHPDGIHYLFAEMWNCKIFQTF